MGSQSQITKNIRKQVITSKRRRELDPEYVIYQGYQAQNTKIGMYEMFREITHGITETGMQHTQKLDKFVIQNLQK